MPDTDQASRYREIRRLGVGGMATVTLAEDTVLGRLVALKRVHSGGDDRGMLRLKREAMVGASLNHPNLVFVYDAQIQDDGDVVIVMEYVEGETLADAIGSRGALPKAEAIRILGGVAAALDAIHEQGIVHRDVKPANVLLGRDGAVKLADLGVADVADRTRITEMGALVGSFSYMAPEQLDGADPSPAMDIYALAALAYEMLSGVRARPEDNPLALAHAIATQPPPDLRKAWPAAPRAAAEALASGMAADPHRRPTSAGELVRRLQSALRPPPPPASPPPPSPAGRRRSALVPALLALAALAVAGVLVATLDSGANSKRSADTTGSTPSRRAATRAHHARVAKAPGRTATGAATTVTHASTSATNSATTPATSAASPAPATNPTPPTAAANPTSPTAAAATAPAAAVEQFYTDAAHHDYPAAWALASPGLRSQLGGYAAFEHQFSSVQSITFHSAQTLPGGSASAATVALKTTSVQTGQTQDCSGTARTLHGASGWLVDRISIGCSNAAR